jgi:hypothetical protein
MEMYTKIETGYREHGIMDSITFFEDEAGHLDWRWGTQYLPARVKVVGFASLTQESHPEFIAQEYAHVLGGEEIAAEARRILCGSPLMITDNKFNEALKELQGFEWNAYSAEADSAAYGALRYTLWGSAEYQGVTSCVLVDDTRGNRKAMEHEGIAFIDLHQAREHHATLSALALQRLNA